MTLVNAMYLRSPERLSVLGPNYLCSEHVVIPRTENTIKCASSTSIPPYVSDTTNPLEDINAELDELDREEFYRLKKVWIVSVLILPSTDFDIGSQKKGERQCRPRCRAQEKTGNRSGHDGSS